MQNDAIRARIVELQAEGAREAVMSVRERAELLTKIARTNITDLWHITQDSIELKYGEIPPELAPAVQEVGLEKWEGRKGARSSRLTIKMHDKLGAIEILNTMSGISDDNNRLASLLENIRAIGQASRPQVSEPVSED
jgi:hypothetical protein